MLKSIIINSFKFVFAVALLYWLISSGKLDFKLLMSLQHHYGALFIAIFLMIFNFVIISYRWEIILRARSRVSLPIWDLLKITWIGQFFSSVLPGSVTGDLIKILYVQKFDESFSKKFIFASILIDRIMGLSGLILLVGISSILFGAEISYKFPGMIPLLNFNYALVGIVIASFFIFFFFHQWVKFFFHSFYKLTKLNIFFKIISLWEDLVLIKKQVIKAVGLSLLVQFLAVIMFWCLISPHVANKMDFSQALAFIPLGFMTLALPIAPSGLGVGHAIFQKLFELSAITNGASLFNIYFVISLIINLLGIIPYLLTKIRD